VVAVAQAKLVALLVAMEEAALAASYSHHPLDAKAVHLTLVEVLEAATMML
jgi:hypothetical protein